MTLDAAVNDERLGFAPRTDLTPQRQMACFSLTVKNTDLPMISGHDARRAWLVTVVPDDISNVQVTANDGRTDSPPVSDDLAIAVVPVADRITRISWTASDGNRTVLDVGALPADAAPTAPSFPSTTRSPNPTTMPTSAASPLIGIVDRGGAPQRPFSLPSVGRAVAGGGAPRRRASPSRFGELSLAPVTLRGVKHATGVSPSAQPTIQEPAGPPTGPRPAASSPVGR